MDSWPDSWQIEPPVASCFDIDSKAARKDPAVRESIQLVLDFANERPYEETLWGGACRSLDLSLAFGVMPGSLEFPDAFWLEDSLV